MKAFRAGSVRRSRPSDSAVPAWLRSALGAALDQAARAGRTTWEALRLYVDDQALSWAGAIGLYLFLSVPPLMVASVYLAGTFVPRTQAEAFIVEQVAKHLPEGDRYLDGVVATAAGNPGCGALSIALLLASGSRMFAAMTSAINVMWRRVDRLTFWRRQALRIAAFLLVAYKLLPRDPAS